MEAPGRSVRVIPASFRIFRARILRLLRLIRLLLLVLTLMQDMGSLLTSVVEGSEGIVVSQI